MIPSGALSYLAVAALATTGCSNLCSGQGVGPACVADWPASRIVVHPGRELLRSNRFLEDATAVYRGADDDGANWVISPVAASNGLGWDLVIGMPEADAVASIRYKAGDDLTLRAMANGLSTRWTEPGVRFGASVLATPVYGGQAWDLLVGAPGYGVERGAVYLFFNAEPATGQGPKTGAEANLRVEGWAPGDQLGAQMMRCADLTGDRHPDILVSAPWLQLPSDELGRQRLDTVLQARPGPGSEALREVLSSTTGGPEPLSGAIVLLHSELLLEKGKLGGSVYLWEVGSLWWGVSAGAQLGQSARCRADLTGDGLEDILVGAPFEGADNRGAVYLLATSAATGIDRSPASSGRVDQVAAARIEGPWPEGWFGFSVATLEADDDDVLELLIGAPGTDAGQGRVALYRGSQLREAAPRSPRDATRDVDPWRVFLPPIDAGVSTHFGRWVGSGRIDARRDLNDDGVRDDDGTDDVIIGAPDLVDGRKGDAGKLWIFLGRHRDDWTRNTRADTDDDRAIRSGQAFARVGRAFQVADLDGDGTDELILPTRAAPLALQKQ